MHDDNEINVLEYGKVLWRRKLLIIALCSVAVIATAAVSLQADKYYKSETVIISSAYEAGGLGAALSAIPFVSAFAGGIQTPADKIMIILKSRTIAESVVKRFNLLRVFFADEWDPAKNAWANPEKPPLVEDAVKMLTRSVTQFSKSKEGAVTISAEWKDPVLAADIANYYINALSVILNEKSININVQVVDRAVPAERKSRPKVALNTALAGVLSLCISVCIAFFLEYIAGQKTLLPAAPSIPEESCLGKTGRRTYRGEARVEKEAVPG